MVGVTVPGWLVRAPAAWADTPRPRVCVVAPIGSEARATAIEACRARGWTVLDPARVSGPGVTAEQAAWELRTLVGADGVLLVFDPVTASQLAFVALAWHPDPRRYVAVCSAESAWRLHVEAVCRWQGVPLVENVAAGVERLGAVVEGRECAG